MAARKVRARGRVIIAALGRGGNDQRGDSAAARDGREARRANRSPIAGKARPMPLPADWFMTARVLPPG